MKKRLAAGLLCLLMILRLGPLPPARAAEGAVCFMAAGDSILPLSDATMPFWSNGFLYVDSAVLTSGVARSALRVSRTFNNNDTQLILYGGGQSLWFEKGADHGYDLSGGTYTPGCLVQNGEVFVPVSVVAQFFGLLCSVTDVRLQSGGRQVRGNLVWIRQPGSILSDQEFYSAATFAIASRYENYLQNKEDQNSASDGDMPNGTEIEGRSVYLCLEAGEQTASLLDTLDSCRVQAAFFCGLEFLESQGDLLRRMAATGQSVGILADAGDPERSVEEQLEAGNRALERATCGMTRLALIQNGGEESRQAARAMGFRCLEPDLDRGKHNLQTASNASSLLRQISAAQGNMSVWLADRASPAGLRAFLTAAGEMEGRCLAWTETS